MLPWFVMAAEEQATLIEVPFDPPIPERLPPTAPISDVEPLRYLSCLRFYREDVERYVEQPLVEACRILLDRNVVTTLTSANQVDLERGVNGVIFVDYNALSEENRAVARELPRLRTIPGTARVLAQIDIPLTEESTVGSVSEYAVAIAERFRSQSSSEPALIDLADLEQAER